MLGAPLVEQCSPFNDFIGAKRHHNDNERPSRVLFEYKRAVIGPSDILRRKVFLEQECSVEQAGRRRVMWLRFEHRVTSRSTLVHDLYLPGSCYIHLSEVMDVNNRGVLNEDGRMGRVRRSTEGRGSKAARALYPNLRHNSFRAGYSYTCSSRGPRVHLDDGIE
jgi:hypothetical protein